MNKDTRGLLTRFFSTPAPPDDSEELTKFALRRIEQVLATAGKALFDSTEYDLYVESQDMYIDGAKLRNHTFVCNTCSTPVKISSEVLHATGDVDEISIYQCERCKNLIFTKYPTTLKLKDY
jgi:hypothetical protein